VGNARGTIASEVAPLALRAVSLIASNICFTKLLLRRDNSSLLRWNPFPVKTILLAFLALGLISISSAHPGSGIVVDAQGQVFFQDSVARTIWKIDAQGKVTPYYDKMGGHWMALDTKGYFASSDPKLAERITSSGVIPAIVVADGGAPIAVNIDGHFYYGLDVGSGGGVKVGMTRVSSSGKQEPFAPTLAPAIEKLGITGLAAAPDGTLYLACLTAVIKVRTNGSFTTLVNSVEVQNCDRDAPTVFLRGLDVDSHGNVYAAACGCRAVVKISREGQAKTLLKAERPWSPTGVATHGDNVYVLEYTHANGGFEEGWLPRVRKVGSDGKVSTVAAISEQQQKMQPHRLIPESNGH
jgi:sugar lactone lactonase YvrE